MLTLDDGHTFCYEMIGEFHSDGPWIHPARTIASHELIYVLRGTVHIAEDGTEYVLRENQMLLLEAGKGHGGTCVSEEPASFYWFHFRTDLPLPCKTDTGGDAYDIKAQLKRLLHITNTPLYPAAAADTAGLAILQELAHRSAAGSAAGSALANRIAEYVRIHAHRPLTVADVAQAFGYNPEYIGKLFRASFRMGLKEHIDQQRLRLARDLLLTTELSVKEIAGRLSWRSENHFVKFFVYHEEISPARFRNRWRGIHWNSH